MRLFAAAIASLVLALLGAAANGSTGALGSRSASAGFTFGRSGGNIAPFRVVIARNGRVTSQGPVTLANAHHAVSADALRGMLKLAQAEGFFSLPRTVLCPRTLPDVASFFVTVSRSTGTKTVTVHGGCRARFNEVYAVLSAVAGITS
jgi:hypothetical protein